MCDKWNITFNERDSLKEIIQDIILYCKSELEYDNNLYQHFSTVALETVVEYYNIIKMEYRMNGL